MADPIATIIANNAVGVFRENLVLVLDKSPNPEYISPDTIHAEIQIKVDSGITVDAANEIARTVRQRIQSEVDYLCCSVQPEP